MLRLMHTFEGQIIPPAILAAVRTGEIGAFCLFGGKNIASPVHLRELSAALHAAAAEGNQPPPLIGIDQEGGQLMAVTGGGLTELPGNMALGATRSPQLARSAGRVLGRELLAMGVNLNFVPCLDVNINPANPVVGTRSFGDDPALVAELGVALIEGIQGEGVLASAKHFPGHGDTNADSHFDAPVVEHSRQRIEVVELRPFRAAIEAGVGAIMSGHVIYPEFDPSAPATLSRAILTDLLRGELGFGGLVLTDAMDMAAALRGGVLPSLQMALNAGVDLVLLAHLPNQMALDAALANLRNPASEARILKARQAIPRELPALSLLGSAEHAAIAQEIADQSITLVRNGQQQLPLQAGEDETIVVVVPRPANLTPADTSALVQIALADAIRARHARTVALELPRSANDDELAAVLEASRGAAHVIVGTINAGDDPAQVALVEALRERGDRPLVISLRTPYDLAMFPGVETYLCTYSIRPASMEAAARVLFGEIPARGLLPCAIPGIAASGFGLVVA
ncbi:MAG: glycoside hydrolase family 3 protein [Anaerolineae bacterium]|nr:glycoside hydrolase family 3 protein [Anaerolineae bacterium]